MDHCLLCGTPHSGSGGCPADLHPTTPERHGLRLNVETPRGIEAYGVLLARCGELWRARILTYPNVLWLVPGGKTSLKFVAATAELAELQAIEFIRAHCTSRNFRIREPQRGADKPALPSGDGLPLAADSPAAVRKIRFLPVRFGVVSATEPGGTGNLSETGMFIITCLPLERGASLRMLLDVDVDDITLDGCVRWMQRSPHGGASPGMGVQLISPPPRYVRYVRGLP